MAVSGKTARRLLKFLLTTDPPSIHEAAELLANQLDNDIEGGQGTLAARPAASLRGKIYVVQGDPTPANNGIAWWDTGTTWIAIGGGITSSKSVIGTEESRESAAFGTMPTPDEVTVVLPENGQIAIGYQAAWRDTVIGAARAAIFIGANQLEVANSTGPPLAQEASITGGDKLNLTPLSTNGEGLQSSDSGATAYIGDVTTGQAIGIKGSGGVCYVFAAAGTYKISVQFRSASGKVTVKGRKLWAWVVF